MDQASRGRSISRKGADAPGTLQANERQEIVFETIVYKKRTCQCCFISIKAYDNMKLRNQFFQVLLNFASFPRRTNKGLF